MKQLVGVRGQFAEAQLAYLRALKNTGVTLRQFTESESLELESTPPHGPALPPSPPPLPPSPPPPPPFSPDLRKVDDDKRDEPVHEENIDINEIGSSTSPPQIGTSVWDYLDPFTSSSPDQQLTTECETLEKVEEEVWAETKTEFDEEDSEEEGIPNKLREKPQQPVELVDDNSSMTSCCTKDTAEMAMVVWSKKTLDGIIKELDDYFLKASAGGKEIAVLVDINKGGSFPPHNFEESKRNMSSSAKVFSALSWSWSSRSLQFKQDAVPLGGSSEPCGPGAHCITLAKLYATEQKLYKEVKEEERTKVEHEKKSMILQKQDEENHDWTKIEKIRLSVDSLEVDIRRLQHSISETCSSILNVIDEELYPQLATLISGLMRMWRKMYECLQVQNHISQRLNHVTDNQSMDFTTDYHHQATAQLEAEVTSWYNSFCKLTKFQRDYVRTLSGWIKLTECLVDEHQRSNCSSTIRRLCENWQLVFDKLPEKVASEAINSFLSAIHAIFLQQIEERKLHKKIDRLEKRLQKEFNSMAEMEQRFEGNFAVGVEHPELSPKHPLILKAAKVEALKKRVESEKAKYLNAAQITQAMTLNNLKTSLPNVFQALMGFSNASAKAFEALHSHIKVAARHNAPEYPEDQEN